MRTDLPPLPAPYGFFDSAYGGWEGYTDDQMRAYATEARAGANTYYVLRHTATGRVMPALMSRSSRGGWSYWNPASDDRSEHGHGTAPRLFETLRGAQNARSAWAQGFHKREAWSGYDWEGIPDGEDNHVIEDAGRKLTDLEIVVVGVSALCAPQPPAPPTETP